MSCRSATTAASAAAAPALTTGSVRGRVAQLSEPTNSVCSAAAPSPSRRRSMISTTPGWLSLRSTSASRSISPARSAGACLTAISRSSDRLMVTDAMSGA